ncbi:MAG: nucleotidyltransferase domain-containing protein [Anaerolineales bacterium]
MKDQPITRAELLAALTQVLEEQPFIFAAWEAGSAAFGRADQWSDIDLMVDVADDHVDAVFQAVEQRLNSLSPINLIYEIPQPAWHGHHQKFYRLERASEFLLIDLAVMKHSSTDKFLEIELHGEPRILFDRAGVVAPPPLDREALAANLVARVDTLATTFDLFRILARKEINRGNALDALVYYQNFTLRPLVELLRIKHIPERYQFSLRYVNIDLPAKIYTRIERLAFVSNLNDLDQKHQEAVEWFFEVLDEVREQGISLSTSGD